MNRFSASSRASRIAIGADAEWVGSFDLEKVCDLFKDRWDIGLMDRHVAPRLSPDDRQEVVVTGFSTSTA
jgi:hypothetical protein